MKKRIIALLLAFCLLLSAAPLAAFAAVDAVTVTFPADDWHETKTYPVDGAAEIGTQEIAPDTGLLFTAPADGCYTLGIQNNAFDGFLTGDLHDGAASQRKQAAYFADDPDHWGNIPVYYFRAGETQLFAVDGFDDLTTPTTLTVEQLGAVTAIEPHSPLSLYEYGDTIGYYDNDPSAPIWLDLGFAVTFSGSPAALYTYADSDGLTVRGKLKNGASTLTAAFGGMEATFTVQCARVPTAEPWVNYLVLGDSIAEGYGIRNSWEAAYGAIIADTNGYAYTNRAYAGATSLDLRYEVYDSRAVASADIISLSVGGNDFFLPFFYADLKGKAQMLLDLLLHRPTPLFEGVEAELEENFHAIIREIRRQNPDATLLVQTVYCPWTGPLALAFRSVTDRINRIIRAEQAADPESFVIVDVAAKLSGHPKYIAADSIHPNAAGNVEIARLTQQTLFDLGLAATPTPTVTVQGEDYDYYAEDGGRNGKLLSFAIRFITGTLLSF